MADYIKENNSKHRKIQNDGLCLWCVIIQCMVCLPRISAKCRGTENTTMSVYPETIRVLYGNPLEIFCIDDKYTADDLIFKIKGVQLNSDKINSTTRRYYKENPDKGKYPYFYCFNEKAKKLCPVRILVDSPPPNVINFTCVSFNLEVLNCSWSLPQTYATVHYELKLTQQVIVNRCEPQKVGNTYYCAWSVNDYQKYMQKDKYLSFNVTSWNIFGRNEENFTLDHYTIVKPAPVINLKALIISPHNVVLEWDIPNNIFDYLPNGVTHKIEYRIPKIDNSTYFRSVNTSNLATKNRNYLFTVFQLPFAHTKYELRMSIRPVEATQDMFWSKYSSVEFYTTGKTPEEVDGLIYSWRHRFEKPDPKLSSKWWRMKAPKSNIRRWQAIEYGVSQFTNQPWDLSWYIDNKNYKIIRKQQPVVKQDSHQPSIKSTLKNNSQEEVSPQGLPKPPKSEPSSKDKLCSTTILLIIEMLIVLICDIIDA